MKLKIRTLPILAAASILNFPVAAFSQALVTHRFDQRLPSKLLWRQSDFAVRMAMRKPLWSSMPAARSKYDSRRRRSDLYAR